MTISSLTSKIGKVAGILEERQQSQRDHIASRLITLALMQSFSQIETGSAESELHFTPAEQAMVDAFAKRYHARDAKQQILAELEQQIQREELEQ